MSTLIEVLDDLDTQMYDNFSFYAETLISTWEMFQGNDGQMLIVHHHIVPAVHDHVQHAKRRWPYNDNPDGYMAEILDSYDPDVIQRAFSDTLTDTYNQIYDPWLESMELQHEHDDLTGGLPPHSTSLGSWT